MKVTLIGAGNVGWHLGRKLRDSGIEIVQVFSRQASKAADLARQIGAKPTHRLEEITAGADLYLLAVADDAIGEVASFLTAHGLERHLLAHTSGATPMNVFQNARHGVFYPLQTFSKNRESDFSQIPFCIDAGSDVDRELLYLLAGRLSPKVYNIDDAQRAALHVAAVFVNNFSNYLFHIGHEILEKNKLPFELLLPLIRETVGKLDSGTPYQMQTGPARRRDQETIRRHLELLKDEQQFRYLYEILTDNIFKTYFPQA